MAEQACRIAGVLTLWRDINAVEVQMTEMESGVALAKFYLSEASRLASAAVISAEIDNAEKLRRWLLEQWHEPEVLVRDVVQLGPNALRETPKARAALGTLEISSVICLRQPEQRYYQEDRQKYGIGPGWVT